MKAWTFAGTSAQGDPFEIAPGVDVWAHAWALVPGETARLTDPLYGSDYRFGVYEIAGPGARIRFAAREVSRKVWCFYRREEG
jgi:hypothetical protein